jgi:cytochrome c biogenesis protein CcmG/thiol:disulfide interchange protein DsbE
VLLDFWASWCGPCRLSVPEVDALFRQSAEGDPLLQVIGINQGEDAVTARRAATELGMTYPVVLDRDMAIGNRYGASSIPLFVLLDTDGTVLWKQVGFRPGIMDEAARIIRERRTR